jgi:hypothetical protein
MRRESDGMQDSMFGSIDDEGKSRIMETVAYGS